MQLIKAELLCMAGFFYRQPFIALLQNLRTLSVCRLAHVLYVVLRRGRELAVTHLLASV